MRGNTDNLLEERLFAEMRPILLQSHYPPSTDFTEPAQRLIGDLD